MSSQTDKSSSSQFVEEFPEHGEVNYVRTWVYLLILTIVAIAWVSFGLPRIAIAIGLIVLTIAKAYFIFADFMHLKFERFGIILIAMSPIVFGLLLYLGTVGDFIR